MAIVLSYYGNRESDAALDQAVRLASWMRTSLMIVVASHECGRTLLMRIRLRRIYGNA